MASNVLPAPPPPAGAATPIPLPTATVCVPPAATPGTEASWWTAYTDQHSGETSDSDDGECDDDHDDASRSCKAKRDDEDRGYVDVDEDSDENYARLANSASGKGNAPVKPVQKASGGFQELNFYISVEEGGLYTCQTRRDGEVDPKKTLGAAGSCGGFFSVDSVQKTRGTGVTHDVRLLTKSATRFKFFFDKLQVIYKNLKPGERIRFRIRAIGKLKGPAVQIYKKGLVVIRLDRCIEIDVSVDTPNPVPRPTCTAPMPQPTATTPVPQPTATTPVPQPTATTPVPQPTATTPVDPGGIGI